MEERKRKEGKGKRGRKGRSTFKTAVKIMKYIEIKLTENALRFLFFFLENALRFLWIKLLIIIEEQKA